jgi:signal transduction histidine kinase
VNISELLEETFISFKPLAEQRNLTLTINFPPQKIFAFIDVEGFNKILTNLLSNAVKYAQSKVHITLTSVHSGEQFFTIEIMNDGYLIPPEMKEKIFEPFFRLKETEKQKGTGIGLALSRSLTQLHKGILELRQPVAGMNHFVLVMPVHQDVELIQEKIEQIHGLAKKMTGHHKAGPDNQTKISDTNA